LHPEYEANNLDAFGLYVYGMILSASIPTAVPIPPSSPSAHHVLIQSILQFPYNWSAWVDLAALIISTQETSASSEQRQDDIEQCILDQIQPVLADNFMYHLFCAHVHCERQSFNDAMLIYERWMDGNMFSSSPYLRSQYSLCCYNLRNYAMAKDLLQELHVTLPYRLDSMDIYSNVLYVLEDSVSLSQLAHLAVQVDKYRPETCCIVGNYYSIKKQRAKAIQYFQRALQLDRTFTSAYTLMGHEYVEWKQTANAMESYRKAVLLAPSDYRAWYGLGQTYELLNMNLHALYYYKQATQLRPYDALMWCALGSTFTQLQRPTDAIRAYERALQQNESENFATQKLATLYRNNNQVEDAAQCYMRHLELVRWFFLNVRLNIVNVQSRNRLRFFVFPQRYSASHSNAASITGELGSLDSLDKMLQEISVESTEAEAIMYLATYYRDNCDFESASS
jgi:anaphase-promoting complex subunit 8